MCWSQYISNILDYEMHKSFDYTTESIRFTSLQQFFQTKADKRVATNFHNSYVIIAENYNEFSVLKEKWDILRHWTRSNDGGST